MGLIDVTPHNMLPNLVLSNALKLRHGHMPTGHGGPLPHFFSELAPQACLARCPRFTYDGRSCGCTSLAMAGYRLSNRTWSFLDVAATSVKMQQRARRCDNDCDRARALMRWLRGLHSQVAVHIVFHIWAVARYDGSVCKHWCTLMGRLSAKLTNNRKWALRFSLFVVSVFGQCVWLWSQGVGLALDLGEDVLATYCSCGAGICAFCDAFLGLMKV